MAANSDPTFRQVPVLPNSLRMVTRIVIARPPKRLSPKPPASKPVSPVIVRPRRHEPDADLHAHGDAADALFQEMRRQLSANPAPTPKRTPKPSRRTSS